MRRFNYLAPTQRAPLGGRFATLAIDNRIGGPLAALLATVVLTATLCVVQFARLHAAQGAYALASIRLSADQTALENVSALRARVVEGNRLVQRVYEIRRESLSHADELAWIGNHLPRRTWLETLRYEAGIYSLEGTSEHAASVGTAMLALRDVAHARIPQLISLRTDANDATARIRYTLRVQTLR